MAQLGEQEVAKHPVNVLPGERTAMEGWAGVIKNNIVSPGMAVGISINAGIAQLVEQRIRNA